MHKLFVCAMGHAKSSLKDTLANLGFEAEPRSAADNWCDTGREACAKLGPRGIETDLGKEHTEIFRVGQHLDCCFVDAGDYGGIYG